MSPRPRPRLRALPAVRTAGAEDAEALAAFRCSTGRWFQDEAERFVNGALAEHLLLPEVHALLFSDGPQLVAVAVHQRARLITAEAPGSVDAAQLVVLAIAAHLHAATLPDGTRLSDHAMRVLLADALHTHRTEVAFAIVAIDNQRSLALCERNGLSSQTVVNQRYARVTGRFAFTRPPGAPPPHDP